MNKQKKMAQRRAERRAGRTLEPPPLSLYRDEKMKKIIAYVRQQSDPAYRTILVTVLLRWIERANLSSAELHGNDRGSKKSIQKEKEEKEIPWRKGAAQPDPLLPSEDVGMFRALLMIHLNKYDSYTKWDQEATQFVQMCTTMAYQLDMVHYQHVSTGGTHSTLDGSWSDITYGFTTSTHQQYVPEYGALMGGEEVEIHSTHLGCSVLLGIYEFNRLCSFYHGIPDQLLGNIYKMLQRYETMSLLRSIHLQAHLPRPTFQSMFIHFGVSHECFAMPIGRNVITTFNASTSGPSGQNFSTPTSSQRETTYNSQFSDTDKCFESNGSFYDFYPYFENARGSDDYFSAFCYPPSSQQDVIRTYQHVLKLLELANQKGHAMTFIMLSLPLLDKNNNYIIQDSRRTLEQGRHVTKSVSCQHYVTGKRTLERGRHVMLVSTLFRTSTSQQHMAPLRETMCLSNATMEMVWLQSEQGQLRWPVTEETMDSVVSTMLPMLPMQGLGGGGGGGGGGGM